MSSHEPYEIMLREYVKHVLSDRATETFETHLRSCDSCREQLELAGTPPPQDWRPQEPTRSAGPPPGSRPASEGPMRGEYLKRARELLQGTPWESKIDEPSPDVRRGELDTAAVNLESERLLVLLHASQIMNSVVSLNAIVPRILGLLPRCLRVERSIVFLLDEQGKLQPFVQGDVEPQCVDDATQYSTSIVQRAAEDLHILSSGNAMNDQRFSAYESIQTLQIKSFMCVPIKSRDEVIGTLYVDNRNIADSFDEKDIAFLRILTNQAGVVIENARLHDRLQAENLELTNELARLRR